MRRLTENEIIQLQSCKGVKDGNFKFFDVLREIYFNDEETLEKINHLYEMLDSLDDLEQYPLLH